MQPSSGFLVVDKPRGVTSFDVVAALRPVLGTRRVGHSGTLDPQATGLMLIGFGPVTRLLSAFHSNKTYRASIRLGASTDTDDAAGSLLHARQPPAIRQAIEHLLHYPQLIFSAISTHLTGTIRQVPSAYSAIRVNGQHAYDLARNGKNVAIPARTVHIVSFDVDRTSLHRVDGKTANADFSRSANPDNACDDADMFCDFVATITCSEGTYVRSLARDLGRLLGVGGYVTALRRTRIGALDGQGAVAAQAAPHTFTTRDGITHTRLKAVFDRDEVLNHIKPAVPLIWRLLPALSVSRLQAHLLETGLAIRTFSGFRANESGKHVLSSPEIPNNPSLFRCKNGRSGTGFHSTSKAREQRASSRNGSLVLGPETGRLVAVCGNICVGVVEKRGNRGLFPHTILDQSFVRLPDGSEYPARPSTMEEKK